jgi:hypothetical protein
MKQLKCWIVILACLSMVLSAEAKQKKKVFDPVKPGGGNQQLIFDVNLANVTKIQVEVLDNKAIINTVKILGGKEFRVGAYIEKGKKWTKSFENPVAVQKLRVNVDKANNSRIRVTVFYKP